MLLFLLFYNFAFKEIHYCIACPPIGETAYQPTITGKQLFKKKKLTIFSILHYEHDWNTVYHKKFYNASLVYRLLPWNNCIHHTRLLWSSYTAAASLSMHESLYLHINYFFTLSFHFWLSVLVIHIIIYSVLHHIRQYWCRHWLFILSTYNVNLRYR